MRKTFVLDTSALIYDSCAWKHFHNSDVIIPIAVLNELDKLKKQVGEAGRNARVCIRMLDELSSTLDITTGIIIENDILVKIDATYREISNNPIFAGFGDPNYGDTQILACAYSHWLSDPNHDVTLVSNDINLRVKAKSRGMDALHHNDSKFNVSDLYPGSQVVVNEDAGEDLLQFGVIDSRCFNIKLNANECVLFENEYGDGISMGRKVSQDKIKLIKKIFPWNISSRNKEQAFAMDLVMDKSVDLVTLIGKGGTGKSLVALACALELVLSKKEYDKLIIYRPIQAVGNDIGYLPGPQPLDAKIATPNGWTTMGEIKVGSKVISRDGKSSEVTGVFPKGKKNIYKVTTVEGASTECCEDHLWFVKTNSKDNGSILSTKEIIKNLPNNNYYLPRNEPVQYDKKELSIPPYSMGAFLGDGCCTDNHLTYYSADQEIINRVINELKIFNCNVSNSKSNKLAYRFYTSKQIGKAGAKFVKITNIKTNTHKVYQCIGEASLNINLSANVISKNCNIKRSIAGHTYQYLDEKMNSSHPIIRELMKLNLHNKKSYDKFIPKKYLTSSIEDRINLLRGLLDTDGTIKKNGEISFSTTSKQLSLDIIELVRSLGGRSSLRSRNRIGKSNLVKNTSIISKRVVYEFNISLPASINPFFVTRKAIRFKSNNLSKNIRIKSIEYIGEKEAQCIKVNHPEHLYLTDDFIVTHNTMQEKLEPWFQAIMDNFEILFNSKMNRSSNNSNWKRELQMFQEKGRIEMEAITYIRGRSIPNAIILVDESQNISKEEVKTILTRAGDNTKIILTGDIEQIDNQHLDATDNGLTYAIEKFKDSELAGHITLTQGERSRLATKAAEIL